MIINDNTVELAYMIISNKKKNSKSQYFFTIISIYIIKLFIEFLRFFYLIYLLTFYDQRDLFYSKIWQFFSRWISISIFLSFAFFFLFEKIGYFVETFLFGKNFGHKRKEYIHIWKSYSDSFRLVFFEKSFYLHFFYYLQNFEQWKTKDE